MEDLRIDAGGFESSEQFNEVPVVQNISAEFSARAKLSNPTEVGVQPFNFNDLPTDINEPIWIDIKRDYNLTLGELSALKKAACKGKTIQILSFSDFINLTIFHNVICTYSRFYY